MLSGKVVLNEKVSKNAYLLGVNCPEGIINSFKPGQFLKIKVASLVASLADPLIPRPFTVHAVEGNTVFVLYQVVGKGTKLLSRLKKGDLIEILAPLGNPFPVLKDYVICAGGIGVAGFGFLLQKALKKEDYFLPERFFYGARSKDELLRLDFFSSFDIPLELATDDGSFGYKGFVTELLESYLKTSPAKVIACGPPPMLKAVARLGKKFNTPTYLVMETFLACGVGFCMGCVIKLKNGKLVKLCTEGPTFRGEEIELDD